MTPDEAFTLLEEANPVPDPLGYLETVYSVSAVAAPHELRRDTMQEIDQRARKADPSLRRPLIAIVGVTLVIGLVATLVILNMTRETPVVSNEADAEAAIQRVHDFLDARSASELHAAVGTDFKVPQAVITEWEWWATFAEDGYRGEVGACTTTGGSPSITISCPLIPSDPVLLALGVDEGELGFVYFPDAGSAGQLKAPHIDGGSSENVQAYQVYLSAYQPEIYDQVCSRAAYESESVLSTNGLALTPQCAKAVIPYLEDIALWIERGRPLP